MQDAIRVFPGQCTVTHEADQEGEVGPGVGTFPICHGTMVLAASEVTSLDCGDALLFAPGRHGHGLGLFHLCLPTMRVTRGGTVEGCVSTGTVNRSTMPSKTSLREWACSTCGSDLSIERERTLVARCGSCADSYSIQSGEVSGAYECGFPGFEADQGGRCLDPNCSAGPPVAPVADGAH